MDFSYVYSQNPWWEDNESIYFDMHIRKFEKSKFKYIPYFMKNLKNYKNGIYIIKGPRQIGKTTVLKLLIKDLIEKNINPSNILYLTLDLIKDENELTQLLLDYFSIKNNNKEKRYLFLDEVSSVSNWQKSIKYLYDTGKLENAFVVLTGSSSYDLKKSSERLPGRREFGKDIVYLPVSFREYIMQNSNIDFQYKLEDLFEMNENELKALNLKLTRFKDDFKTYISTGGFPKVINDFLENNAISEETLNTYGNYLYGDVERFNRSRLILNQLLFKTPDLIGQRFSWNSLSNDIEGVSSKNTIEDYFNLLSMNFLFGILFFYDFSKKTIKPKKQKKIYPLDLIITFVIEKITNTQIKLSTKIKQIVFTHLLKYSKDLSEGLMLYNGPYFWYSQKGKEIDFLINLKNNIIPIEVKFQNNISPSDYSTMKKVFQKGILVTKNTLFKKDDIVALPIESFLLLV
ncbi:ATPase AAA [Thermosipho melanesiensis]|uniref:AAA ATPase n=2 Tax=Thermosipho melanesiensis TaxID=46541 RepID=A6LM10_THEM4|nr:ATP-binding protein [Thermosipho melanesiensis]ABR30961.1 AAA ATPase [Thermosipho melanesiensis BI429]APT74064.1 ATPase AAA [Thermosipho melanesiensis]OOC36004.1 ATPase AAA [Thermosipho melanesiensis]OOC38143.1 ATPase AAA [Thermosipho melanesiensis]OOC38272.1 ATPase AAA [Thermosipho melanesiensis]